MIPRDSMRSVHAFYPCVLSMPSGGLLLHGGTDETARQVQRSRASSRSPAAGPCIARSTAGAEASLL